MLKNFFKKLNNHHIIKKSKINKNFKQKTKKSIIKLYIKKLCKKPFFNLEKKTKRSKKNQLIKLSYRLNKTETDFLFYFLEPF